MTSAAKCSLPKNVKLGSNCIICKNATIHGDVTIGNGTIVHPRASIIAEGGPIVIGECNLIEDKAVIINSGSTDSDSTSVMTIGNFNVFEVGSRSQALKIGDYNVLEGKAVVGKDVVVSNHCIIGAGCVVTCPEILPENTAFYGPDCAVRLSQGVQPQVMQMDFLYKCLPNYHFLMKKKSGKEIGASS